MCGVQAVPFLAFHCRRGLVESIGVPVRDDRPVPGERRTKLLHAAARVTSACARRAMDGMAASVSDTQIIKLGRRAPADAGALRLIDAAVTHAKKRAKRSRRSTRESRRLSPVAAAARGDLRKRRLLQPHVRFFPGGGRRIALPRPLPWAARTRNAARSSRPGPRGARRPPTRTGRTPPPPSGRRPSVAGRTTSPRPASRSATCSAAQAGDAVPPLCRAAELAPRCPGISATLAAALHYARQPHEALDPACSRGGGLAASSPQARVAAVRQRLLGVRADAEALAAAATGAGDATDAAVLLPSRHRAGRRGDDRRRDAGPSHRERRRPDGTLRPEWKRARSRRRRGVCDLRRPRTRGRTGCVLDEGSFMSIVEGEYLHELQELQPLVPERAALYANELHISLRWTPFEIGGEDTERRKVLDKIRDAFSSLCTFKALPAGLVDKLIRNWEFIMGLGNQGNSMGRFDIISLSLYVELAEVCMFDDTSVVLPLIRAYIWDKLNNNSPEEDLDDEGDRDAADSGDCDDVLLGESFFANKVPYTDSYLHYEICGTEECENTSLSLSNISNLSTLETESASMDSGLGSIPHITSEEPHFLNALCNLRQFHDRFLAVPLVLPHFTVEVRCIIFLLCKIFNAWNNEKYHGVNTFPSDVRTAFNDILNEHNISGKIESLGHLMREGDMQVQNGTKTCQCGNKIERSLQSTPPIFAINTFDILYEVMREKDYTLSAAILGRSCSFDIATGVSDPKSFSSCQIAVSFIAVAEYELGSHLVVGLWQHSAV
ncbi:hypothetical protein EJB05_54191, partial [Eragrostis curvula]